MDTHNWPGVFVKGAVADRSEHVVCGIVHTHWVPMVTAGPLRSDGTSSPV